MEVPKALAVLLIFSALLLASAILIHSSQSTVSRILAYNNTNSSGLASIPINPPAVPLTKSILSSQASGLLAKLGAVPAPANWDEQIGSSFTQGSASLAYNITAVAQNGSFGYGPAYLLNGLSSSGFWYQIGLAYNWPYSSGGYNPGFNMVFDVFNSSGRVVFPTNGGGGLINFSGPVNPGDRIQLSLYFSNGNVVMVAHDQNTSASASINFTSQGSTSFVGDVASLSNNNGFFTGLMTEEYHVFPYVGNTKEVPYILSGPANPSAWQWADEWAPINETVLFSGATHGAVVFNNSQLHPFFLDGAKEFINGSALMTGSPSVVTSISNITINAGQNVNITLAVANGTAPYTYRWLEESPNTNSFNTVLGASTNLFDFTTNQSTPTGLFRFVSLVTDAQKVVQGSQTMGVLVVGIANATTSTTSTSTSSTTTTVLPTGPTIVLPPSVLPSGILGNIKVPISATGFTPNTLVNFGYTPLPPFKNAIIAPISTSSGSWSGTFSAPWIPGSYTMVAVDANGITATATLVVSILVTTTTSTTSTSTTSATTTISSGPRIVLPQNTLPSNTSGNIKVTVSGSGFTPNTLVNFGYSPIPPFSSAIIAPIVGPTGNWSGTFSAPWKAGTYNMVAIDSSGVSASATLSVT